MDPSVSGKDKIWFLRVCHHVPHELYVEVIVKLHARATLAHRKQSPYALVVLRADVDVVGNEKTATPTGIGAPVSPAISLVTVGSITGDSVFVSS